MGQFRLRNDSAFLTAIRKPPICGMFSAFRMPQAIRRPKLCYRP